MTAEVVRRELEPSLNSEQRATLAQLACRKVLGREQAQEQAQELV